MKKEDIKLDLDAFRGGFKGTIVFGELSNYVHLEQDGQKISISDEIIKELNYQMEIANYIDYVKEQWDEYCEVELELEEIPEITFEECKYIAKDMIDYLKSCGQEYEMEELWANLKDLADNKGLSDIDYEQ